MQHPLRTQLGLAADTQRSILLLTVSIVLSQPAGTEMQVTEQRAGHNSGANMAAV